MSTMLRGRFLIRNLRVNGFTIPWFYTKSKPSVRGVIIVSLNSRRTGTLVTKQCCGRVEDGHAFYRIFTGVVIRSTAFEEVF